MRGQLYQGLAVGRRNRLPGVAPMRFVQGISEDRTHADRAEEEDDAGLSDRLDLVSEVFPPPDEDAEFLARGAQPGAHPAAGKPRGRPERGGGQEHRRVSLEERGGSGAAPGSAERRRGTGKASGPVRWLPRLPYLCPIGQALFRGADRRRQEQGDSSRIGRVRSGEDVEWLGSSRLRAEPLEHRLQGEGPVAVFLAEKPQRDVALCQNAEPSTVPPRGGGRGGVLYYA